jgi:hypothetical protein
MRTDKKPRPVCTGAGLPWRIGELYRNHPAFVTGRQSKSDLRHDLRIVRQRLAVIQTDPLRMKLAAMMEHLRRRIETELHQAKGNL